MEKEDRELDNTRYKLKGVVGRLVPGRNQEEEFTGERCCMKSRSKILSQHPSPAPCVISDAIPSLGLSFLIYKMGMIKCSAGSCEN